MEISYGHDRYHPVPMPNFQSGFLKGLVLPLFESLDQAVENLDLTLPVGLLHANVDQWQMLMAKMNAEIIAPTHSKHETNRRVRRSKSLPSTPKSLVLEAAKVNDFPPLPAD